MKTQSYLIAVSAGLLLLLGNSGLTSEIQTDETAKSGSNSVQAPARQVNVNPQTQTSALQTQSQPIAPANPLTGEQIKWEVISSGGGKGISTNYALSGTVGQTAAGQGSSTNYKINQGFWQNFSCCLKAGDANHDSKCNVGDAVYLINYVFKNGSAPSCRQEGDANADSKVNVGDAVYLINYVFKAGATPNCGP